MDGNRFGTADYRLAFICVNFAAWLRYRISIATRDVVFGADWHLYGCVLSGQLADIGAGDRLFSDAVHAERSVQHALDDVAADCAVLFRHLVMPMDAAASG